MKFNTTHQNDKVPDRMPSLFYKNAGGPTQQERQQLPNLKPTKPLSVQRLKEVSQSIQRNRESHKAHQRQSEDQQDPANNADLERV